MSGKAMELHPCPKPRPRRRMEGYVWVCPCGKAFVLRRVAHWGDLDWEWQRWSP